MAENVVVVSLDRARMVVDMDELRSLKLKVPKPAYKDELFMERLRDTVGKYGLGHVATHLDMSKSTLGEWIARGNAGMSKRELRAARAVEAPAPMRDAELSVIQRCMNQLDPLDQDARHRVLCYLDERYFGLSKAGAR